VPQAPAEVGGVMGPTMGCFVEGCGGATWPDEDWLILDTPVGSFEVVLCDEHYDAYDAGRLDLRPQSWTAAIQLIMDHPVVHA
jgi:hypothetical protein